MKMKENDKMKMKKQDKQTEKPKKSKPCEKPEEKPCEICYGCGWHPLGYLSPIGPIDAGEWGNKVIKCPFCGAGSVDSGERWDMLVAEKKKRDAEAKEKEKK